MLFWKHKRIMPAQIILIGFALLILLGTGLLMLPFATRGPGNASFLEALFTATSATCVTGLVVQDTGSYWTTFGQFVIMMLIQVGGMGVVTAAVAITMFSGKKIGLKQRWVMQESISAHQMGGIVRMTGFILRTVFLIEGLGAVMLALRFCPQVGLLRGLWYAVFHAVSSFCNAGFDLLGTEEAPFVSLTGYTGDPVVNLAVMLLIVLGGIGFLTWQDIVEHRWHLRSYRLQSKLILTVTALLLVLPAVFFYCYEFQLPQWQGLSASERGWAAAFQSVTPRTAGYNTVDLTQLSGPSQMLITLLMLIGGSPGSTAGGFKTTTLAVFFLAAGAVFRKRSSIQCFGRRLREEVLHSAVAIGFLYIMMTIFGGMFLSCMDGVALSDALFETASAIGTVGLSMGITADLSAPSQLLLVFLMYFGRVGGLTLVYAVMPSTSTPAQLPQELITVG